MRRNMTPPTNNQAINKAPMMLTTLRPNNARRPVRIAAVEALVASSTLARAVAT